MQGRAAAKRAARALRPPRLVKLPGSDSERNTPAGSGGAVTVANHDPRRREGSLGGRRLGMVTRRGETRKGDSEGRLRVGKERLGKERLGLGRQTRNFGKGRLGKGRLGKERLGKETRRKTGREGQGLGWEAQDARRARRPLPVRLGIRFRERERWGTRPGPARVRVAGFRW